jgi:Asp-tRNA(Asn)/Glu-tRNA(Gln) amidotransferase A subunit family amidase
MPYTHPLPLAPTAAALRSGALDLHAHVDAICDRIEAVDSVVRAFLPEEGRRARLHAAADELLAQYPDSAARPRLFGVLAGVKDIFHVEGFVTRAGSSVPPEAFGGVGAEDAAAVRDLRAAGALILGKTVTTEFAYFEPGPTANPHDLAHTPGGSSSGSAAAVAAGLTPLALGTQTIGSVIRPAAFCGVVGFKPTLGRIPTAGLVYFSPTIDHVGLFTQDAAGMRLAAAALCREWHSATLPQRSPAIGVPAGPYLQQAGGDALTRFEIHLGKLEAAGAVVHHIPALPNVDSLNALHRRLVMAEFARQHAAIYPQHAAHYRPRTVEIIEIGRAVDDEELARLRQSCARLRTELTRLMDEHELDLWASPAAPGVAPEGLHATGDPNMNLPWTHAGLPAVTVPAGTGARGLPLGLQLAARFGADETLLAWAQEVEGDLAGRADSL